MKLVNELTKLIGKKVQFQLPTGTVREGVLREVREDHLVFFDDGEKDRPTLVIISSMAWIRKAKE